ncbi:M48 family metalloprotease [Gardnerella vaginalis]|uniref:M48 family metalloprotease n=1 Tax=Gardnerella vaginalis TaxID=2702 RepID=UPI0039F05565
MLNGVRNYHYNSVKAALFFGVVWFILALFWVILGTKFATLIWLLIIGVALSASAYWFSSKLAIFVMRAVEVTEDEEPVLYGIVREMSAHIGKPMPSVMVSPHQSPNAFATGRSERHASICFTRGLINILNERELRGVVSHELMHIYNHDILASALATSTATVLTYAGSWLVYVGNTYSEDARKYCKFVGAALNMLFAPIAAVIMNFNIPISREFDADRGGCEITGDSAALASALNKISYGLQLHEMKSTAGLQAVASLMIIQPWNNHASTLVRLCASHPPVKDRIKQLISMAA